MSIPFVPLGPVPESGGATAAEIIAAFKADAVLGTASGGMVANAAQVLAISRAATAVTPGAPQQKHLENALGTTLQTVYEVHDGDLA